MKIISVENVSKKFILAHDRPKNLADASRNIFKRSKREDFWAVNNVSFEMNQGESLGIIGHNGAGKSTMLKLLTRIMKPTHGNIRTRGRLSALIEVGAGFHPEMTGRENTYLNGSILGMTRREIDSKFDDIVSFAGLEQFIDTPVKRYSSGMYVRLGFAIAAYIEPEILLVDEVLAVGDLAFQSKCIDRMNEMRKSGVSIVLISHNLRSVETFCHRCIVMRGGEKVFEGTGSEGVKEYETQMAEMKLLDTSYEPDKDNCITVERVQLLDKNNNPIESIETDDDLTVAIDYCAKEPVTRPNVSVGIIAEGLNILCSATNLLDGKNPEHFNGRGTVYCTFQKLSLKPGLYEIWFDVRSSDGITQLCDWQRIKIFRVQDWDAAIACGVAAATEMRNGGAMYAPYKWDFK